MDTSALTALSTIMDTSDPVVFASVATAALVLFLFIWRIVFFFTADADLTLLLKGPPPEGAFEDKVVWITGASQGIGQELAQRFAAMGARLILSSRSADRLEAVRATCRGKHAPEGVVVLPFDLKGGADVLRGAVRQAESAFRGEGACGGGEEPCGVDVLVLNAAHPRPKLTCEDTPEDTLRHRDTPTFFSLFPPPPTRISSLMCRLSQLTCEDTFRATSLPPFSHQGMLEVNVVATIELTRYLLPGMMQRNKGQILVVSSAAGKLPAPTQGVYAATKHALHGYFNTLRYEAVQHGVAVTLVCPGPIATEGSAEGAVKLATKPSADQLHVPAAAGGDEKDSRMPASRCAELIVSAAAWRLEEAWISRHPVLLLMYLGQYFPATCSMLFSKIGPKRVQALKTGSSNMYSTSLLFTRTSSSSSSSLTSLSSSRLSTSSTSSPSRSPSPTHLPRATHQPHKSLSSPSLTHTPSHTPSHIPAQRSTTPSPRSSPPRSSSPLSSLSSPSLSPSSLSPALSPRRSPISTLASVLHTPSQSSSPPLPSSHHSHHQHHNRSHHHHHHHDHHRYAHPHHLQRYATAAQVFASI
ncbi:unnamed protein product [Closterium sp. NIES-53]